MSPLYNGSVFAKAFVTALIREFGNLHGAYNFFIIIETEVGAGALEEKLDAQLPAKLIELVGG